MKKLINVQIISFFLFFISVHSIKLNSDDNNNLDKTEITFLEKSFLSSRSRGFGCINFCSGHGTCINGICICDELYDYVDCSSKLIVTQVIDIQEQETHPLTPTPEPPLPKCPNNCNCRKCILFKYISCCC